MLEIPKRNHSLNKFFWDLKKTIAGIRKQVSDSFNFFALTTAVAVLVDHLGMIFFFCMLSVKNKLLLCEPFNKFCRALV